MDPRTYANRYRAESYIGVGGRLEAYTGVDTTSQARIALLVGTPADQTQASEWTRRAQSASTVQSPQIARITDWGQDADHFFVVQDWVAGTDIGTMLTKQGPLPSHEVARIGAEVAAALSAAHAHGVVHGDLRPEDIVQLPDGEVMLAGLAAPSVADPWRLTPGVEPHAVFYLSPEQCIGQAPTNASDVYSLGAVLYQLATGRPPIDGPDAATICAEHQEAAVPSPKQLNPNVGAPLDAVIMRALAKNPASRYGSAEEMRQALVSAQATGQTTAVMPPVITEPPAKKRLVWPWIVLGIVLVAALLGFVGWWTGYIGGVQVPNVLGQEPQAAQTAIQGSGLTLGDVSAAQSFPTSVKAGTVYQQTPAGGSRARKGTPVAIVLAGGETAAVPDVVAKSESEAIANITQAGFTVAPVQRKYDSKVAQGMVISQTPEAASEQLKGSAITIVVSKGAQTAAVPSVTGQSQADATKALQDAGFKVQVQQQESADVAKGDVITQAPAGGVQANSGTTVTIYVSTGPPAPKQVQVPNVVGQTQNQALTTLQNAGLKVQIESVTVTNTADKGKVTAQDPAANTTVNEGTTVTIKVGQ